MKNQVNKLLYKLPLMVLFVVGLHFTKVLISSASLPYLEMRERHKWIVCTGRLIINGHEIYCRTCMKQPNIARVLENGDVEAYCVEHRPGICLPRTGPAK